MFAAYFLIICMLLWLSELPVCYVLKKSLVVFPFVLVVALFIPFFKQGYEIIAYDLGAWHIAVTYEGLVSFGNMVTKAWLSILSLILFTSSTKLTDILSAMNQLGVPKMFILIIAFMYRYIFVLADQLRRMKQAGDSRNFGGRYLHRFNTLGNMIGTLFIRSYERGERVYAAMLARGYHGEAAGIRKLCYHPADAYFGAVFFLLLITPPMVWL